LESAIYRVDSHSTYSTHKLISSPNLTPFAHNLWVFILFRSQPGVPAR
jgi:hypothetical protein